MSLEEKFAKMFPEYVAGSKLLSPYWDLFEAGAEEAEKEIETQAEEIKKLKKELDVWKVAYSELTRHRDELKQELKKYKE